MATNIGCDAVLWIVFSGAMGLPIWVRKEEKEGIQILEKRVEGKPVNLYELEEMVFEIFRPIQKAVLEKAASSLSSEEASECRHCLASASELNSEGVRKKLLSRFGEIVLERRYCYCKKCKKHGYRDEDTAPLPIAV